MSNSQWRDRIVLDPRIHHGDACIRGTRIPVSIILGSLAEGMSPNEIVAEYPQLTEEDIAAVVAYGQRARRRGVQR